MGMFLEWNPRTRERLDERCRLRVGTVEDREIGEAEAGVRPSGRPPAVDREKAVTADQALDRLHHEFGFRSLGGRGMDRYLLVHVAHEFGDRLAFARADHLRGRRYDRAGGTVIALEADRDRGGRIP